VRSAAEALRAGRTSSVALVEAAIERADQLDPLLGVYVTRFDDHARTAAARADEELARGIDRGPLHGIPVGVKDVISTDEGPTTAQSLAVDPLWSERGDGAAVRRLRTAGAVIMGKTTTMEFACGMPDP